MRSTEPHSAIPQGRALLSRIIAAAGDVIHIEDVTKELDLSRAEGAKRLARWTEQGWLRRVGRGAYIPVSIDTLGAVLVLDDPWVLVPSLYAPAYVGGRTAAEHWDLTEQIFKDIVVLTAQAIRERRQLRHGAQFVLKHVDQAKIFGTKSVWRRHTKVPVSDVHRTIVDMLDDPAVCGGIQHVADCLYAYLRRADRDDRKVIQYAERLGNGAVFKRLGFLADRTPLGAELAAMCRPHLSTGNAKLDPAIKSPRLITKWRVLAPDTWVQEATR
jgi:predicted transcriptional regulator of viral defense system